MEVAQVAPNTVFLAGDEAGLYLQATTCQVWAPIGQTPVVRADPGRAKTNFYGSLNLQTGQEIAMRSDLMNAQVSAQHLELILEAHPDGPILLFWDRVPWHRGKPIDKVLEENPRLEIIFFPTASPDLNPQEQVWKAVRKQVSHNHLHARLPELADQFLDHLKSTTFKSSFEHGWRMILNGIFYILQSGCAWRMLPRELPPWKTVYHYFRLWRKDGTWERLNRLLREKVRLTFGKKRRPSAAILDSQSIKTSEGGVERGFDAGKKVTGRRRHTLVDTLGLLLKVVVTAGDVQDREREKHLLEELSVEADLFKRLALIRADGGYRGEWIAWIEECFGLTLEIVEKSKGQKGFQVLPKRWIVERTFAWLVRQRRLARDYERLPETSEALIYAAIIRLMIRRLATL